MLIEEFLGVAQMCNGAEHSAVKGGILLAQEWQQAMA